MQVPKPGGGDVRANGMPSVRVGSMADAAHFGGGDRERLGRFGDALNRAGNAVGDVAARRQEVENRALANAAINQLHQRYADESKAVFDRLRGPDAAFSGEEIGKLLAGIRADAEKTLTTAEQRRRFASAFGQFEVQARAQASARRDREMERYDREQLAAKAALIGMESADALASGAVDVDGVFKSPSLPMALANADALTAGQSPEARELARRAAAREFHDRHLAAVSGDSARALEYLGRVEADEAAQNAFAPGELKEMREKYGATAVYRADRELGDRLGEEYDEDDDLHDAVDEVMPDADDKRRESVRRRAALRIKTRRSAKARERRELEDSANQAMRAAGWNAAAIDPNWPEDLRDKMLDKSEKELTKANTAMQRQEKAERKARGLECLKLSPDELDRKILAGEWTDMLDDIGPDSPEGKALIKLANSDNPASQSSFGGRGGRTMLQYASSEYERLAGNPRNAKKRPDFVKFIQRVEEERDTLAEELGVDPQLIPNDKQKEIIDKCLMNGDWRWFEDFPHGSIEGNR